jgi:hypothetical protein
MFKNVAPKKIFNRKVSQGVSPRQLLDFALAEYSSAVEMLQAAKLVDNKKLAGGFVAHALDEYRHTDFFLKILSNEKKIRIKFDPRLCVTQGFVRTNKFLFETCDLNQFSAFVSVNEANALRIFLQIRPAIEQTANHYLEDLDAIIEDEREHMISTGHSEKLVLNYQHLLNDEQRHALLSDEYLKKISTPYYRIFLRTKYSIGTWLRHLWASQDGIRTVIDISFSFIAILAILPFRAVLKFPESPNKNLTSIMTAKYML